MDRMQKRERIIEVLVEVGLFTVLFIWGMVQPIDKQPDERCRYVVPYYIMMHGKLPNGTVRELVMSTYGISYAFFPGLPYLVMAPVMKITSLFTHSSYAILMSARAVNMLAGAATWLFMIKTGRKLFKERLTAWFFALTAVLWPQVLFIFTYVNCDAFAYMSCAIMAYALVSGLREGWSVKNYVLLSVGVSVCALSYYNAYGMILGSVIVFVFSFFYQKKENSKQKKENSKWAFDLKKCLQIGLTIVGLVFLFAGWWFIRNAVLYDGDFLGFEANRRSAEHYAIDTYKPSLKVTLQNSGNPVWCLLVNEQFRFLLKQSFFARFGNMDLLAPNYIIRGFKLILFVGILGLLLRNRQKTFTGMKRLGFDIGMLVAAVTAFVLTYWYSYSSDYQPQGRYLLPGLIPMLCLIFVGIQNITGVLYRLPFGNGTVAKWAVRMIYAGCFCYLALSTVGCVRLVWHQYLPRFTETLHMVYLGGPI